jgi:hypothetical protein
MWTAQNMEGLDSAPEGAAILARSKTDEQTFLRMPSGRWYGSLTGDEGWSTQQVWDMATEVHLLHPVPSLEDVTFDHTSEDLVHIQVENHEVDDQPPTLDTDIAVPASGDWEDAVRGAIVESWGPQALELVDLTAVRERLEKSGHARMHHQCAHGGDSDFVISLWYERAFEPPAEDATK